MWGFFLFYFFWRARGVRRLKGDMGKKERILRHAERSIYMENLDSFCFMTLSASFRYLARDCTFHLPPARLGKIRN